MTSKPEWTMPQLTVFGNVETITQGCDKKFGSSDGYTFMGATIVCAS